MALWGSIAFCGSARALTDEDVFAGWRFHSAIPGARAAGMARAGIALVDDPAALRINPARLAALSLPQASFEMRWRDADPLEGSSGLIRTDPAANPFAGSSARRDVETDQGIRPAFLAYAHPMTLLGRPLVLGWSRTEAYDLSVNATTSVTSVPVSAPAIPDGGVEVTHVSRGSMDARIALYDVGAGWRISPSFSAGVSLSAATIDLRTRTRGLLADPLQLTGPGMFDPRFGTSDPAPLLDTATSSGDTALAFSFGSWWRPSPALALATVFRRGPAFEANTSMRDKVTGARRRSGSRVRVPDAAAIGLAWNPFLAHPSSVLQSLVLLVDVERASGASLEGTVTARRTILTRDDAVRRVSAVVDGDTQVRVGMEVQRSYPDWTLALRAGAYNERDPVVRIEKLSGDVPPLEGQAAALREAGYLERPDTEVHVTAGAGFALWAVSFDLGLDVSSVDAQVAASATWRFGR